MNRTLLTKISRGGAEKKSGTCANSDVPHVPGEQFGTVLLVRTRDLIARAVERRVAVVGLLAHVGRASSAPAALVYRLSGVGFGAPAIGSFVGSARVVARLSIRPVAAGCEHDEEAR